MSMPMTSKDITILIVTALLIAGLSFALSAILCAKARRRSLAGLVAFPGGALGYRVPVSLGGGVAIWQSTLIVLALGALTLYFGRSLLPEAIARHVDGLWYRSGELAIIVGLATVIMIVGLVDDLVGLRWRVRLGFQVAAGVILATFATR